LENTSFINYQLFPGLPTFFGKGVVVVSEVKVLFMLHEAVEKIDPPPPTSQKAVVSKSNKVENTLEVN